MSEEFTSLKEFYPYYKTEHSKVGTRVLHFIGTSLFFVLLILFFIYGDFRILLVAIVSAYFFAWIGHFFVERNKPATFQYPLYSLFSDFKLYFEIIVGKEWLFLKGK